MSFVINVLSLEIVLSYTIIYKQTNIKTKQKEEAEEEEEEGKKNLCFMNGHETWAKIFHLYTNIL